MNSAAIEYLHHTGLCCLLPATMLHWTVAADAADRAHEPQLVQKVNLMPPKKKIASMQPVVTKQTQAEFVLGQAPKLSAAEVVHMVKTASFPRTPHRVHNTRWTPKHKTKTAAKPACMSGPRAGSPREQFVALLLDLGLARASELLGTLKERVKQVALR